ncbi:MAG: hypothetical protein U5L03_09360 [Burkholderiaceae bacterium]|nr:hypothetical protein [Burkholderiaceae bacterium]
MFDALKVVPAVNRPTDRATLMTSLARTDSATVSNQSFTPCWSSPRDVRRGKDGVLRQVLGGAHSLLYFDTTLVPSGGTLVDRVTRGDFSRSGEDGRADVYFAAPRSLGGLAGGTIFADIIVFRRDGRSALASAPIGALLQIAVARLTWVADEIERGFASRLKELDASMTPQAVADGAQARVRAIEVFGGTHADYLRSVTVSAAVPVVLGSGFALLGAGLLIAAVHGWRRARRTPTVR